MLTRFYSEIFVEYRKKYFHADKKYNFKLFLKANILISYQPSGPNTKKLIYMWLERVAYIRWIMLQKKIYISSYGKPQTKKVLYTLGRPLLSYSLIPYENTKVLLPKKTEAFNKHSADEGGFQDFFHDRRKVDQHRVKKTIKTAFATGIEH